MKKKRTGVFGAWAILASAGLAVAGAPSNDSCETPLPVGVGVHNFSTVGATTDIAQDSCGSAYDTLNDVFYAFTAPTDATYEFSAMLAEFTPVISLYTSCQSGVSQCGWTGSGSYGVGGSRIGRYMETGETIIIRIACPDVLGPNPSLTGLFTILDNLPPANDTCSGAITVNLGTVEFNTTGGFVDELWGPQGVPDVFFKFTPTQSGRYKITTCGSFFDTTLSASYSCNGADIITSNINYSLGDSGCSAVPGASRGINYPSALLLDVQAGRPLYLRVGGYGTGSERGYGNLNISLEQAISSPANETCATASTITTGQTVQIPSLGVAAADGSSSCGSPATSPDVWFKYIPNYTGYAKFDTCSGSAITDTVLSLYTASCASSPTACNNDGCFGGASEIISAVTSGTTYLVRVGLNSTSSSDGIVNSGTSLRVTQVGQPPANDACANAIPLTQGQPTPFDNTNATTETALSPSWPQIKDLWYSANIPASGVLNLSVQIPTGSTITSPALEVLSSCGGTSLFRAGTSYPNPYPVAVCAQGGAQSLKIRVGNLVGSEFAPGQPGAGVLTLGSFIPATTYTQPPVGFVTEGEDCATRVSTNVDNTNRGVSGLFTPLTCGTAVAATLPRGGNVYDYDYFSFELSGPSTLLFMGSTEAASNFRIYNRGNSEDYNWVLATTSPCLKTFTATIVLPQYDGSDGYPPNYALTIEPLTAADPTLCAADENYWLQYFIVDNGSVTINTQPVNKFAQLGGSATFTVAASGASPKYQWRRGDVPLANGGSISGANSASLTISNISNADLGAYNVVITSGCGAAISNEVTLAIGNACAADFNGVNGVTVQDIFDFLTAWLAGSPSANFNGVNGVTVQDIFDFLTAWLAGC